MSPFQHIKHNLLLTMVGIFALFTLLFLSPLFVLSSNSSPNSVNIVSRDSKSYGGLTYEDHVMNYWKLTLSIPEKGHPWFDPTGEKCRVGQEKLNSPIFYLPTNEGGGDERICRIPAGLGVLIPVIVGEYSLLEYRNNGETKNLEDLPRDAKNDQDKMRNLELRINNTQFAENEIKNYGVLTSVFNVTFADNGLFGVIEGGPTSAAADGYYIITEPLSKGTYVIYAKGDMCNNPLECPSPNDFTTRVKTTLIVE